MPGQERNKAMAEQGMVYDIGTDEYVKDPLGAQRYLLWLEGKSKPLTRFDPSTKTRVPVTQEWVDEAVAEIVRLNVEISVKDDVVKAVTDALPPFDVKAESDRIWDAVVAASSR
jgi:hypothetical protein